MGLEGTELRLLSELWDRPLLVLVADGVGTDSWGADTAAGTCAPPAAALAFGFDGFLCTFGFGLGLGVGGSGVCACSSGTAASFSSDEDTSGLVSPVAFNNSGR